MKTCSSSQTAESSSPLVSTADCYQHCSKVKKQSRDGVYTLCAMTSGMRRNWVQAVLKNVRPGPTPDVKGSVTEQQPPSRPSDGLKETEHTNSCSENCAEESQNQQKEQKLCLHSPADKNSAPSTICPSYLFTPISPPASPTLSPNECAQQREEGGGASCCLVEVSQTGVTDTLSHVAGAEGNSTSTTMPSKDECLTKSSNMQSETEQRVNTTLQSEEQQVSGNKQKTGQLVKELELTQRELSRLQKLNRNLLDELRQQRESQHLLQVVNLPNGSPQQALALQRLQKMNLDLRSELEALKRSQEETREAELRQRVDLLAQQAQLLVTGDATALAQAHLEQDRRQFQEQRVEWERCVASLKSQLSAAEEQRGEAESRFTQLQQEVQGYHSLQEDAEHLQKNLQDMKSQLQANEEAQAQKETRLQKHLLLLKASQERERRSLAASLAQEEQHSQDLQQRLEQAEEQVGSLSKTQTWTREIETAQQQLQEELTCTVSAVRKLQEERKQLERRCEELQSQLSDADGEVSRLQSRLKTDETHYYNLEHSYERACEELQVALGKVKHKETDTADIREGYERLLDRKEQELTEILLKMEVLGNSLEETEVKLNEMMKVCTCSTSGAPQQQNTDPTVDSGSGAVEHAQTRSESSHPCAVTATDDQERFMSVIQALETKLYVTEEKLRDIMQRLEEQQGHTSCQDPHLCSQLTRSRANAQHLSLLLHSQAKQSQRFAQGTENRCRMLLGRFQVALNIIQACREKLQANPINITEFERQLASAAACLQQGEKDAEKQVHESRHAGRGEDKILNDEASAGSERKPPEEDVESVGKCLMRELFVTEKMVSVLQSQRGLIHSVPRETEGGFAQRYRNIVSQRIALKLDRTQSGRTEYENTEPLESTIHRVCAEAELIYTAFRLQQQNESGTITQSQGAEHQRKGLADINPPELAPYEGRGSEAAAGESDDSDVRKVEAEKEADWLQRLIPRLQRRAECLNQLCQETSDGDAAEGSMDVKMENAPAADLNRMQEHAKMIYLLERLSLDYEHQTEELEEKLQALRKEEDVILKNEQEALNHNLCQLQEDNSALRDELERAELKIISVETGNQRLLENMQEIEDYHEERINKLEAEFQEKITELQHIHEEEMKYLHCYYTKSCLFKEKQTRTCTDAPAVTECASSSPDQTVTKKRSREELGEQAMGADAAELRGDHEILEAPCDGSFTALEEMHRQLVGDLQQQHEQEVAALLKEKDHLLQEETASTMAAIVAMRRAHKQELERSRRAQHIKESADITQLQMEYDKELQVLQKELDVLSVQHTQKCLESAQLNKELQEERQSSVQYQRENQELKKKQRETEDTTQQYFSLNGKQLHAASQGSDFYEMEVILRAREAEMQFLRQEARSLREELKIARLDKIYAHHKLKALYTNNQDEPNPDVNKHCEDFNFSTLSLGRDAAAQSLEDTVTNTNNAAFLEKTKKSSLTRQIRGLSSMSLKDGLSAQERMKLFES
ncbi:nuclear mitotic apparatus protein 1-like [Notolabrus celidotus]|uniref:nuclear mitotic apparatus protein 1-like n=1 Tax=Notolabrus celidotus TaxID=1203425 RepID=UPI00148FDEBA|nr:nuclear mitotic apparatus protein 1-like [Notolabrus celidotus]XP_034567848.1 nuclear mitotic apparatus protein 1-like [Notolabrus celidotus]